MRYDVSLLYEQVAPQTSEEDFFRDDRRNETMRRDATRRDFSDDATQTS